MGGGWGGGNLYEHLPLRMKIVLVSRCILDLVLTAALKTKALEDI